MATSKISESCVFIYLLGLTSVIYVTPINNSAGIVGELRISERRMKRLASLRLWV
jgi:hypothetical protein